MDTNIKKPFKDALINIKEGTKDHFFKFDLTQNRLLHLKKRFDGIAPRLKISENKKFKTLINWKNEQHLVD